MSLKRNYGPALIALATANVYLCNLVAAEDAFKRAKKYDRRQVSQLEEWAREQGCTQMETLARKGLAKKLTKLDYRQVYQVCRKDI